MAASVTEKVRGDARRVTSLIMTETVLTYGNDSRCSHNNAWVTELVYVRRSNRRFCRFDPCPGHDLSQLKPTLRN